MAAKKIAITLEQNLVEDIDRMVSEGKYPNRSRAIQEALRDKISKDRKIRLKRESAKLSREQERNFAEEGLIGDAGTWPEY